MLNAREPVVVATIIIISTLFPLALGAYYVYIRERRAAAEREEKKFELEYRKISKEQDLAERRFREELEREQRRIEADLERESRLREAAEMAAYQARKLEEDRIAAASSGPGSGGYIVVDMPETERPLFHDLLKGFEDYGKLKGYEIAFSIDSSLQGRIAFKFTLKNEGFGIGPERVRRDFKDFVAQVQTKDIDELDNLPIIVSVEEHNLIVTLLKNRISFLQHNYNLSQNSIRYYERLISNVPTFPALPAPTVIVQNGGNMDSRRYSATNSHRLIQGDHNVDSSINIGGSFNERQERITALDDVIQHLGLIASQEASVIKTQKELGKVRDELADESSPDPSSVQKWMESAKNSIKTAALGFEVTEAVHKLFTLFGLS